MRLHLTGALIGALLLVAPAQAQVISAARAENTVPSAPMQEILIKTALLTFNDANLTGNYTVMHAKLAKAFRDRITPERLKEALKTFADQKADLGLIAAMTPVASSAATINTARGSLELRGYFATKPSRVTYELDFLPSEGQWKLAQIDVRIKPLAPGQ
jgi:hypothetical protein